MVTNNSRTESWINEHIPPQQEKKLRAVTVSEVSAFGSVAEISRKEGKVLIGKRETEREREGERDNVVWLLRTAKMLRQRQYSMGFIIMERIGYISAWLTSAHEFEDIYNLTSCGTCM